MKRKYKISKSNEYIEKQIIDCIKDIILNLQIEFDVEYQDTTYRELYLKSTQFAKEINEILSSEIINKDALFNQPTDFFSAKNDKLV
jgi:hypothetical protein